MYRAFRNKGGMMFKPFIEIFDLFVTYTFIGFAIQFLISDFTFSEKFTYIFLMISFSRMYYVICVEKKKKSYDYVVENGYFIVNEKHIREVLKKYDEAKGNNNEKS